jgi:hypothetical protein
MYKKCYSQRLKGNNKHLIHLWTDEGYSIYGLMKVTQELSGRIMPMKSAMKLTLLLLD